jgi:hypothetical protein
MQADPVTVPQKKRARMQADPVTVPQKKRAGMQADPVTVPQKKRLRVAKHLRPCMHILMDALTTRVQRLVTP